MPQGIILGKEGKANGSPWDHPFCPFFMHGDSLVLGRTVALELLSGWGFHQCPGHRWLVKILLLRTA